MADVAVSVLSGGGFILSCEWMRFLSSRKQPEAITYEYFMKGKGQRFERRVVFMRIVAKQNSAIKILVPLLAGLVSAIIRWHPHISWFLIKTAVKKNIWSHQIDLWGILAFIMITSSSSRSFGSEELSILPPSFSQAAPRLVAFWFHSFRIYVIKQI